jgi:signal transduction histidine kinase
VQEAHAIARLLLADVRDVVGQMRGSSQVNLAAALATLAGGPGPLETHLDLPETIALDPAQAQALLRAVQEIVTNASRHARAHHLWIRIELTPDGVHLHARDDGRGAERFEWGHGLTGMRERFEEHAGRVEVTPGAGHGFELRAFLPRPVAAL